MADAFAKFLRAPGADGMVQMELVGGVMEEVGIAVTGSDGALPTV